MKWTAIIPIRLGGPRKTRLAGCLTAREREQLADRLFAHVAGVVRSHPHVAETIVLSPIAPDTPDRWHHDEGKGLNAELEALIARLGRCNLLVVHADLPLLCLADLTELIAAAESAGIAIAPDHHGQGTNALAMRQDHGLAFAFGPGSLVAHRAQAPDAPLVDRPGLAHDVDGPADLAMSRSPSRSTALVPS